jgi:transcriptional regulator with XRE-family HTH domain
MIKAAGGFAMELDYKEIGKRIARRRKQLGLKQFQVEERADIGYKYLSNIERAISIPSTEVIMKLALALETTPDEFLVGASLWPEEDWRSVAEKLRTLNAGQLELVRRFIDLAAEQPL